MAQVFVSYAREDDLSTVPDQKGWVSFLYLALEAELLQRGLLDVALWRDKREVREFEQFGDDIEEGLQKSDILIAVLSPVYIKKEWCKTELNRFAELVDSDKRSGRERIFKVVKREIPLDEEPEPLRGQVGYKFFAHDPESDREVPFYHPGRGAEAHFWDVVLSLSDDLAGRLQELGGEAAAESPAPPTTEPSQGKAFLAFTTNDLLEEQRSIRGELEAAGLEVVPAEGETCPLTTTEFESAIAAGIDGARFSLHLLGSTPGFTPDGAEAPIAQLQLEAAREAGLRRIIWIPRLEQRDERQASLVAGLRDGVATAPTDEIIEEGFDRLKGFLAGLTEPREEAASEADAAVLASAISQMSDEARAQLKLALGIT